MIFITGDTHRDFFRIWLHCQKWNTSKEDLMIILGDSCINYYGGNRDTQLKKQLEQLPITFMLVHGNHEMQPANMSSYKEDLIISKEYSGFFLAEEEFPSLLFAVDGERYKLNNKWAFVYGGAYSVDKPQRIRDKDYWFEDEQLTENQLNKFYNDLVWSYMSVEEDRPDIILTHTCPYKYIPREMFLPYVKQSTVDNTMELWLDKYEELLPPEVKWYCGHWHTDKTIDRMRFLYKSIAML